MATAASFETPVSENFVRTVVLLESPSILYTVEPWRLLQMSQTAISTAAFVKLLPARTLLSSSGTASGPGIPSPINTGPMQCWIS